MKDFPTWLRYGQNFYLKPKSIRTMDTDNNIPIDPSNVEFIPEGFRTRMAELEGLKDSVTPDPANAIWDAAPPTPTEWELEPVLKIDSYPSGMRGMDAEDAVVIGGDPPADLRSLQIVAAGIPASQFHQAWMSTVPKGLAPEFRKRDKKVKQARKKNRDAHKARMRSKR